MFLLWKRHKKIAVTMSIWPLVHMVHMVHMVVYMP
jgi:hypothetical protein